MDHVSMTELLLRAVALVLDKLNEHNPETGYLFAIDHGLAETLTMLTLVHACARGAIPKAQALATIQHLEEQHNGRHTRTHGG